jgi:dipeptidase
VAQSRSWLPDPIGGILWFGVDDTYSTVYVPMYCGILGAPKPYAQGTGNFNAFSWDSAFWIFNFVSNFTYSRYCDMIRDVQTVQRELEGRFFGGQQALEEEVLALYRQSPRSAMERLTEYSSDLSDLTIARWKKLGEFLIWKYLDGNVRDEFGKVTHPEYSEHWYKAIVKDAGDRLKMKKMPGDETGH